MIEMRTNIEFATFIASHFTKNPEHQYTKIIKIILQYLKRLKKCRITYGEQSKSLMEDYLDFNWVRDKKSRKLISGFIFMLNGGLIS